MKASGSRGTVRIIAGQWRRTPLPVVDRPGLRPTPDRVRETLFNWLGHAFGDWRERTLLDLFAGSGALGFEAASRGAGHVTLVESDPSVVARLEAVRVKLDARQIDIRSGDARRVGRALLLAGQRFDAVFLDPPFGGALLHEALPLAAALCGAGGFVYAESDRVLPMEVVESAGLAAYRADRAGEVFYHLLQRKKTDGRGDDDAGGGLPGDLRSPDART